MQWIHVTNLNTLTLTQNSQSVGFLLRWLGFAWENLHTNDKCDCTFTVFLKLFFLNYPSTYLVFKAPTHSDCVLKYPSEASNFQACAKSCNGGTKLRTAQTGRIITSNISVWGHWYLLICISELTIVTMIVTQAGSI